MGVCNTTAGRQGYAAWKRKGSHIYAWKAVLVVRSLLKGRLKNCGWSKNRTGKAVTGESHSAEGI